jgi:hypothetical protein
VSNRSAWGGFNLPLIIVVLGILGIFVDFIFFVAFVAVLGYYLYRLDKRLNKLEGGSTSDTEPPKKPGQG